MINKQIKKKTIEKHIDIPQHLDLVTINSEDNLFDDKMTGLSIASNDLENLLDENTILIPNTKLYFDM